MSHNCCGQEQTRKGGGGAFAHTPVPRARQFFQNGDDPKSRASWNGMALRDSALGLCGWGTRRVGDGVGLGASDRQGPEWERPGDMQGFHMTREEL